MSEELKKLEELLANDRKIIEENYKEIERLKEINKELGRDYSSANNGYLRLHSIIKEVREKIIKYKEILETGAEQNVFYIYLDSPIQKLEELLEILDGVDKENI